MLLGKTGKSVEEVVRLRQAGTSRIGIFFNKS